MIEWLLSHGNYLLLLVIFAAIKQEIARGFTGRPSLIANTASIFATAKVWNGSEFKEIYPSITDTCNTDNPSWNSTIIDGETWKSCITTDNRYFRFAVPRLVSIQKIQIETNNHSY